MTLELRARRSSAADVVKLSKHKHKGMSRKQEGGEGGGCLCRLWSEANIQEKEQGFFGRLHHHGDTAISASMANLNLLQGTSTEGDRVLTSHGWLTLITALSL